MNIRKSKKNNGITLIALVITIIVMLILVAVTISMAINGGLFEQAGRAVSETQDAINKEQTLANGQITVGDKTYASIDDYLAGRYVGYVPTYNEASKDAATEILKENAKYISGNQVAVIPKGFKVLETEGTTIEGGLVITDSNETNEDGENLGNQFVWIPVEKAIVTESEIAKIKADSENSEMTDLEAVQSLVNNGTYPMAVEVNTKDGEGNITATNYKGILYNFSGTDTLTLTVKDWNSTSSYREPAVLSSYDNQTNFTTYGLGTYSDTLYQNAYNQMVKRVAQNGGFYVGRYEISTGAYTDAEGKTITYAQSQKDQTALVSTTWYEMYKYERDYAKYNPNLGVTSEMIWGSQWDQMMIFVNGKNDGAETPAKFYVTKTGSRHSKDSTTKTGMRTVDQVANIFDLESSRYEWTQEASSSGSRVSRGGNYGSSDYASRRYYNIPTDVSTSYSSRLALYIK